MTGNDPGRPHRRAGGSGEGDLVALPPAPRHAAHPRCGASRAGRPSPAETVLVHSSLEFPRLGRRRGAVAVVQALLDALGPTGRWWSPPRAGTCPTRRVEPPARTRGVVGDDSGGDARRTTRSHAQPGRRCRPGDGPHLARRPAQRPSADSFAAWGPRRARSSTGSAPDCRLGERSPLARLETSGAPVLLLGAGTDTCTGFHLAEYRIPAPLGRGGSPGLQPDGAMGGSHRRRRLDGPFEELGADFERDRPRARDDGVVGSATCRLFLVADAVAYARPVADCAAGRGTCPGHDGSRRGQGLVVRYGSTKAVRGLSLVAPGRVTAVLGPNGAGKTTTVETCEGYRRPDAGTVRVLGLDPVRRRPRCGPRIGVMLQSGGVYPGAPAPTRCCATSPKLHAAPARRRPRSSSAWASPELRPHDRTGGSPAASSSALALAMAVVGRPELVFLDEPTAGLDPQARRATWDLVRELRADGVSVVLTTHFMDEAEQLADHVVDRRRRPHGRVGLPRASSPRRAESTLRFAARPGSTSSRCSAVLPPAAPPPSSRPARTWWRRGRSRPARHRSPPGAPQHGRDAARGCPWGGAPSRTSSWS